MFQRFDKRKKLLHNLASVLMKKFNGNAVRSAVRSKGTSAAKHAAHASKQGDLHDAKRWFRIAGLLQQTTKRKLSQRRSEASGSAVQDLQYPFFKN